MQTPFENLKKLERENEAMEKASDQVVALKQFWSHVLPTAQVPADSQFILWLKLHDGSTETVKHGLREAARKNLLENFSMSAEYVVKYASTAMNRRSQQARDLMALLEQKSAA